MVSIYFPVKLCPIFHTQLSIFQVAGFLSDAILQSYKVSLGEMKAGDQEVFFDPADNFHQVVRLCSEPSLLGNRLLSAVAMMGGGLEETSDKGFIMFLFRNLESMTFVGI